MTAVLQPFHGGEKVRVKVGQGYPNALTEATKTYRVLSTSVEYVQIKDDTGSLVWWYATRFEKAPSTTAKAAAGMRQIDKVRRYVAGAANLTLKTIAEATGSSETAASARLRDLRREGYEVDVSARNGQRFYSVSLNPVSRA